jgi:predicted RNA polymerase sigma factor
VAYARAGPLSGCTLRQNAPALGPPNRLVGLTDSPTARLNRAVAVGEADGLRAGLAELDPTPPCPAAIAAYLHERDGDPVTAARLYAEGARSAPNLSERDKLTQQAARLNVELRS